MATEFGNTSVKNVNMPGTIIYQHSNYIICNIWEGRESVKVRVCSLGNSYIHNMQTLDIKTNHVAQE